jgi:hypothetical protein
MKRTYSHLNDEERRKLKLRERRSVGAGQTEQLPVKTPHLPPVPLVPAAVV